MKTGVNRSGAKLGWLDYVLTAVGSMLAVYSAGMSIDTPEIGYLCSGIIFVGTLCSFGIRALAGTSRVIRVDGFLYAVAAIAAISFAPALSTLMPEGGFPIQMAAAGGLCWMLVFGSFLSWSDNTLLFQAVPGIALFGLVGCYDTFRNVVFAFFGFLICLCTGFARAHGREMLRKAADSGYFDRAGIRFEATAPEQSAELYDAIKKGPWRWVAGPEWALLSGLTIVLISLLGAPLIQYSVQGVAGFTSVHLPASRRRLAAIPALQTTSAGIVSIGQGPVTGMTGQPIYNVVMDRARYLRFDWSNEYTGKAWTHRVATPIDRGISIAKFTLAEIKRPKYVQFSESPRVATRLFALPGEFDESNVTDAKLTMTPEGTYYVQEPIEVGRYISGESFEAEDPLSSSSAIHPTPVLLRNFTNTKYIHPNVIALAHEVTKNCKNDREKAQAIMQAIADRTKYNANVAATPVDDDPVAYFLFESKQGYCDVFASAMVLMARAVNIPSRYVRGYYPDPQDSANRIYVVKDKDFHAWAELFFRDVGWVVYDPTTIATLAPGGEVKVENSSSLGGSWMAWALDGAIGALVMGAAAFFWFGRDRTVSLVAEKRTEIDKIYVSFARTIRSFTGRRRLLSETPSEFLNAVKPELEVAYEKAESLTKKFEAALYAPNPPSDETLAELRADLKDLRETLVQNRKQNRKRSTRTESTP